MTAYDIKCAYAALYAPKRAGWEVLEVPELRFIAVDGRGDPNTADEYRRAVEALYAVAYTMKFASKRAGRDFVVGPLEGLWWSEDWRAFASGQKDRWEWTMMISLPEWIGGDAVEEAKAAASAKKGLPAIASVYRKDLAEGLCAQVLHIGPYDDEAPVLEELHERFLPDGGLEPTGTHHEVYLGDPRKAAPERLRTVLRQPVRKRE
ncbi:GyrI-like domain-containing protein [Glycomyces halotolerans]